MTYDWRMVLIKCLYLDFPQIWLWNKNLSIRSLCDCDPKTTVSIVEVMKQGRDEVTKRFITECVIDKNWGSVLLNECLKNFGCLMEEDVDLK